MSPKIMHLTHNDLDGVGCAILSVKAYGKDIAIIPVNYSKSFDTPDVNEVVNKLIDDDALEHMQLLITDISVNDTTAKRLDKIKNVVLLDHHSTAKRLTKYPWCVVDTSKCGAKLAYDFLSQNFILDDYKPLINLIDVYDRWQEDSPDFEKAQRLNLLMTLLGRERFADRFIQDSSIELDQFENFLIDLELERQDRYIKRAMEYVYLYEDKENGCNMACIAAEQYISKLGHAVLDSIPDIEYVMLVNHMTKVVSLRGRGNIDVAQIAKNNGGGGHPKAAGFKLAPGISIP